MITGLFIYNQKGEVLISRLFREGVKRNVCEVFRIQVISNLSDVKSPVLTLGSTTFLHIRHGLLWLVVVTRSNVDASLILEFQNKFIELLKNLLLDNIQSKLTENDIKNNFSLIYEILDETIEFGYVSNMDLNSLKPYLTSPITKSNPHQQQFENNNGTVMKGVTGLSSSLTSSAASGLLAKANTLRRKSQSKLSLPIPTPSAGSPMENSYSITPWRPQGIKYKKNEAHIEVTEEVNLLVSSTGSIIRSFVEGTIKMNSKLSGMPTCSFGLAKDETTSNFQDYDGDFDDETDSITGSKLTDCTFHQCVSLKEFDEEGLINFIPPDGEFELMKYRADVTKLPFSVYITFDRMGGNSQQIEYKVELTSNFTKKITAENVIVKIPTPPGTIKTKITSDSGKSKFMDDQSIIQWQLKKISGLQNYKLTAIIDIVQHSSANGNSGDLINRTKSKPPISMNFTMDMFTVSGNHVKFLKIVEPESKYSTVKWVKYVSKAKNYEIRM